MSYKQKSFLPQIFSLSIPKDELKDLIEKAKDWALMHGAGMRSKVNFSKDALQFAPFVLLPSPFPRKEFLKAVKIQLILNELMHKVAHNKAFLRNSLKATVEVDEFTANLFKIFDAVEAEGVAQPISLGLLRSDLMLETTCHFKECECDTVYCCWKQVEINTIASGFGWLGPSSAAIQRCGYALQSQLIIIMKGKTAAFNNIFVVLVSLISYIRLASLIWYRSNAKPVALGLLRSDYMIQKHSGNNIKQVEINSIASSLGGICTFITHLNRYVLQELGHADKLHNLPENKALEGLCDGMISAWEMYGDNSAAILFIVEDISYNICDQRFHEFQIRKSKPQIKVIRKTLTEVAHQGNLGSNKELLINNVTIAVVYFRAGYEPGHYPSQKEWDARLLIERSKAIKCPSIHYHLAGTKKVQQALARPGSLEMFLSNSKAIDLVKEIFTGLYSLDFDEYGDLAIQMAIEDPERFVLKPQREGGGNNVYGKDIRDAVMKMKDTKERTAWILMERINPPIIMGYMIRPGSEDVPEPVELVYELGIFGVVIGDANNIYKNKQVGHMLRTKISTANEGGVAAGLGALDSPYLID